MNINEKIYALRRRNGWSQDEFAEKLNVSRQSVSKWESGRALPDSEKILLMSELFSVTTDFLLKDSETLDIESEKSDEANEQDIPLVSIADDIVPEPSIEDNSTAEYQQDNTVTDNTEDEIPEKKHPKHLAKKTISWIVVACLIAAALIIPYPTGLYGKALAAMSEGIIDYPYVLVHGLGGYGPESKINEAAPYWGATTGSLANYLGNEGYTVCEASVGPFSSTWDRTCELYAQLTGTRVDYGEAHSKANNHERYGRTYTAPLFESWGEKTEGGQIKKVNLVGHSFGGETVRMLAYLMAYGDKTEKDTSGDAASGLFTGGKSDWVNSVTTLCSPHNGSTLFYVLDTYKVTDLVLDAIFSTAGIAGNTAINKYYDFHLDQFGISSAPGESKDLSEMKEVISNALSVGNDNAAYDLSPDGAKELNEKIKTVEDIYYFSYSYQTTVKSNLTGNQVPKKETLLILMLPATLMGSYSVNTTSDFQIDETWLPNDGLANVVSAKYPLTDEWQDYDAENIVKGKWNVMPTREGDHGTVIGLNADETVTHTFYNELINMINSQPRDKKYYFSFI